MSFQGVPKCPTASPMRSREPEIDSKVSQSVPKLCSVTFCVLSRCPKVSHCVSKSSKEPKIYSLMSHSVPKRCPVSLNVLLKCPLVSQSVPKSPKASQNGVQRLLAYFQDVPKCPTVSQKVSQSKGRRYEWLGWGGGGSRRRPAICRRRPRRHVLFDVVVGVVSQSTGVAHKPRPPHSLTHTHTHTHGGRLFFFSFLFHCHRVRWTSAKIFKGPSTLSGVHSIDPGPPTTTAN